MIKKASIEDLKQIAKLYYTEMANQFKEVGENPISAKKYEEILNKNFDKSEMYILYENKIKGFLWYVVDEDEYNLEEIFVVEKEKGYGKLLMEFLLKNAKENNVKKINLDVHFNNKQALEFFKKYGFSERTIEMSLDLN